jgi:crotonobetainyl-CoA:carnitine CoA-transferase CaiB-like acyl-CoA transferase
MWRTLCRILEKPEWTEDERFHTNADRVQHRRQLAALLEPVMLERTTQEWIDVLRQNRLPCGPIQTVGQVCEDPQVLARDMIVSLNHPKAGPIRVTGLPLKLSDTPGEVYAPPPMLGQHTSEVLQDWLGLGASEVEALQQQGVI